MKKFTALLALVAVAGLFLVSAPQKAEARAQYMKAFVAKYDIAEAKEKKCGVCHGEGGKNKKKVSDYGKALAKALGKKNQKDKDAIEKAFTTVEGEGDVDGKTYGELLKAGKLPPAAE